MADRLWHAVTSRDRRADGLFVYAVRTTRIYCRPSCASRKPARARVEFFPAPAMAEAHGYRACRRCHPDRPDGFDPALDRVRRACVAVGRAPGARWTTPDIARAGGATPAQIQRGFRERLGVTPREYVAACRRRMFLAGVRAGRPVTDAVYEAGFGSPSRMYDALRLPGMTPATYGRGGAGAQLRWRVIESRLGTILVAATARGACFVAVGSDRSSLLAELRAEFPRAAVEERPSSALRPLAEAARGAAEASRVAADLPLDIRGTAFQWRVWRALTAIPCGTTRSYRELAAAIGAPRAVRAVAGACAANPLALLVPCHRVVGTDGSLRGYRWGTAAKHALLERERSRTRR